MSLNSSVTDEEKRAVPSQEVVEQVHRIIQSESLKGSEVLRNLLDYLLVNAISGRLETIKVKEIARDVFGRSDNFDSQTDSVVRVHTGRLRSKLAEYYVGEGAEDDLIIGIPKGSYGLTWHPRRSSFPVQVSAPAHLIAPETPAVPVPATFEMPWLRRGTKSGSAVVFALVVVFAGVWLRYSLTNLAAASGAPGPCLATFWRPFVTGREQPLIVFSTFHLGGSLETEVHALSGETSLPSEINTYTTTGEVMGVFEVTRMLASFGQGTRAKHGQLLTWDEAKDSNLIFVGGPLAQTPLRSLAAIKDLEFRKGIPGLPPGGAAIVNLRPQAREQTTYAGPVTRPFRFDYGIVAIKPTFNPNRRALILAGITEYGTQGAADFVTQEDRVNELLNRLHVKPGTTLPSFEALIRVKIEGDVPVQYELVLAHFVN